MKKPLVIFGAAALFISLTSMTISALSSVDLSDKGIPVVVDAPNGSIIEEGVGHGMEFDGVVSYVWEITNADDDFSLEVAMDDEEMWQELEQYVADYKEFAEMDEGFVEFVAVEKYAVITKYSYEDEDEYEFYYVMEKDGKAIEFRPGLGQFDWSQENMKRHLEAAKSAR